MIVVETELGDSSRVLIAPSPHPTPFKGTFSTSFFPGRVHKSEGYSDIFIQKGSASPLTLLPFRPLHFPGLQRHYRRMRSTKRITYWPSKLSSRRASLAEMASQVLATMSTYIAEILFVICGHRWSWGTAFRPISQRTAPPP
jgi:hypothetical protein